MYARFFFGMPTVIATHLEKKNKNKTLKRPNKTSDIKYVHYYSNTSVTSFHSCQNRFRKWSECAPAKCVFKLHGRK